MTRLAIAGGPRTGKTTLAKRLAVEHECRVRHTDDLIELGWSEASENAADWLDYPGPLIVEGVAVARALRKWLRRGLPGSPVDVLVVLRHPLVARSEGQERMAKGVDTVLAEIEVDLVMRGVKIVNTGDMRRAADILRFVGFGRVQRG